ncbi:hypothetical protein BD410DRAFT_154748 [Rickenella mellea]|uniref:Uncharacterized protein n=1 Tax=Rickenella mellea TaxID=50990 RepID=A0A4Y7PIQ4_9AGAM|nr:hypothetical protein BD410DRAFT_154748 [Rickenella mellea]
MDGVDHLLNLLAIVKSESLDVAFAEDANYRGLQSENFTFRPYPEPLRSLRQSLEDSKLCMAALKGVSGLQDRSNIFSVCQLPCAVSQGLPLVT